MIKEGNRLEFFLLLMFLVSIPIILSTINTKIILKTDFINILDVPQDNGLVQREINKKLPYYINNEISDQRFFINLRCIKTLNEANLSCKDLDDKPNVININDTLKVYTVRSYYINHSAEAKFLLRITLFPDLPKGHYIIRLNVTNINSTYSTKDLIINYGSRYFTSNTATSLHFKDLSVFYEVSGALSLVLVVFIFVMLYIMKKEDL
jgi:hypothetical protein